MYPFPEQHIPQALDVRRARNLLLAVVGVALSACGAQPGGTAASPTVTPPPASAPTASEIAQGTPPAGLPGGWLMFSRFDESTHTFLSTHLIRPDGTGEVELTLPGPEGGGRWSRDGSHIAVMTILDDGRVGTAILEPDGTVVRVLEIPDPTLNLACNGGWSPMDEHLACEGWDDTDASRSGVYTVRASDGGDLKRLSTAPEGMNDIPGDFSPDGRHFIFKRTAGEADGPLMLVDVAGGQPRPLSDQRYGDPGRFSPDGDSVLTSSGGRLVILDLGGKELGAIEETGAILFGAVWSPDGEWIAYSRTEGGFIADVFVSRIGGTDVWQVTDTAANEIAVAWGPEPP